MNPTNNTPTTQAVPALSPLGHQVDTITLNIDYTIIQHFSKHLYSSPNKAIEELVINGFDAAAREVHVFLRAPYVPDKVVVWDNGNSMDIDGLKALWLISDSPKNAVPDRIVEVERGEQRKMIGKFGIGKIASYTLGDYISHVCRQGDTYLLVKVDYRDLLKKEAPGSAPKCVEILELSSTEIDELLDQTFVQRPKCFKEMRACPHWTLAIIDELKTDKVTPGRLKWVLGNSMPLRPDFKVWVEEEEVAPQLLKSTNLAHQGDFGNTDLQEALVRRWKEVQGKDADLVFGEGTGIDKARPNEVIPFVEFPKLGKVWGVVRLYHDSLLSGENPTDSEEERRSYGFFIMVLDRLLNDRDPKLLLKDPSYATFYRTQYILHVDGLDADLLADRERFQRDTDKTKEFIALQNAVYSVSVKWRVSYEQQGEIKESLEYRLPQHSRPYYIEPLTAALQKNSPINTDYSFLAAPIFKKNALGNKELLAKFSVDNKELFINIAHPYYQNVASVAGGGSKGRAVVRELDLLAISEKIFEGYLIDLGLKGAMVDEIMAWRNRQYELLSGLNEDTLHNIVKHFEWASSQTDGETFENALVSLLKAMGFEASRDGARGEKDVLMKGWDGDQSYDIIFELKGKSKGALKNDDSETGGAAAHRDAVGAEHAVIVGRQFAGFIKSEVPAILKECLAIKGVSIMQTDAFIALAHAMDKYHYTHGQVKEVFTAVETPEAKLDRIARLAKPTEHFDFNLLLDRILLEHLEYGDGSPVAYRTVFQKYYKNAHLSNGGPALGFNEFETKLYALYVLAETRLLFDSVEKTVALTQSPQKIREAIAAKLAKIKEKEGEE